MSEPARYYDGVSAETHRAMLRWVSGYLIVLRPTGDEFTRWPRKRITASEADREGTVTLSCTGFPGRVKVRRDALPASPRESRLARTLFRCLRWPLAGLATCAALLASVAWAPRFGAALVPFGVEARLGATAESTLLLHRRICHDDAAQDALDQLEARLAHAAGLHHAVHLTVVDDPMINALALPGARIVVMRGMIEHAGGPNQLAGVLAHETGHLANRDPLTGLLRSAGIGAITAGLGIDTGFGNASPFGGMLVRLAYSRDMERAADAHAIVYLQASGLRSDGLAAFFASVEKREGVDDGGNLVAFLADHPRTSEREALARGSSMGADAMTEGQWQTVRRMCQH